MRFPEPLVALTVVALAGRLAAAEPLPAGLYAEFTTPHGAFVAELFYQKVPLTVANFTGLAEGTLAPRHGAPYYTGLKWYRVVPGFVIQSGNPLAPAEGDTGYSFPDEFYPGLRHGDPGILSMANGGPDTNSGEFFVTLGDCTRLNYMHSVFGRTIRGLEVLAQIKPDDPFSIRIIRIGAEAQAFPADQAAFSASLNRAVKYTGEPEPGPKAHFDDAQKVLPQEVPRAKNFNYKLNNFQRATGRRLFARVYPAFTPTEEGKTPAAFTQQLAQTLGLHRHGVLATYFAGEDQWYVWIGEDLMPEFNPEKLRASEVKKELYQAVKARAAVYTEQARIMRGPVKPLTPADLAKYSVDAMLDLLIFRFEPAPKP